MASVVHENGWISLPIDRHWESKARGMRAQRDQLYGNIYAESVGDERWVGELGEMAFRGWLNHRGCRNFRWIQEDAAGKPDFIIGEGVRVGIKTVKRSGPPKPDYTAQISAQHAREPVDQLFFFSYEFRPRVMWLLGGISHHDFMRFAKFYRDGEWVHENYQVRGHDIYNTSFQHLTPPDEWLAQIIKRQVPSEPS